ncbi:MAG: C-GCAxxG-C-C family protein [Candidatus Omnitrophota bacterium]|jgi:hypothetical protein
MLIEKARNNFLGKSGARYNCAQSVIKACSDLFGVAPDLLKIHAGSGGGNAPDGYCGALYAALYILNIKNNDKSEECKDYFLKYAGALTCKEIKSGRKVSCVVCVEKAAEFLNKVFLK